MRSNPTKSTGSALETELGSVDALELGWHLVGESALERTRRSDASSACCLGSDCSPDLDCSPDSDSLLVAVTYRDSLGQVRQPPREGSPARGTRRSSRCAGCGSRAPGRSAGRSFP